MKYYQLFVLLVLASALPAIICTSTMQRSCSGKCDLDCPSGRGNCSIACNRGPCSLDCGAIPGCSQLCMADTYCSHLKCTNPQECYQSCEGKCDKIHCNAGMCSQRTLHNTPLTCEANLCLQETMEPEATQQCNSKKCGQMCHGGACKQYCEGEKCDQMCMKGNGCKQVCKSKDAKECGQQCANGGCEQTASAINVFQNCSGGDCTMTAFNAESTRHGCLKGHCKITAVSRKNTSITCKGDTCDAHCDAPYCKIRCVTEKWCKISCKNSHVCESFCVSDACRVDCPTTTCISHKVERLNSDGFLFGPRDDGSTLRVEGPLFLFSTFLSFILAWLAQ